MTFYLVDYKQRAKKKSRGLKKKFDLVAKVFLRSRVMHWFDWTMDIFLQQVNHEEKSQSDWMHRHILEKVNCEEKKGKTVNF